VTRAAAERWAKTWELAWNRGEVEPIVALYADGCIFSSEPFRRPYGGRDGVREYVAGAFAQESDVTARFGQPIVGAEAVAVPWWATLVEDGEVITLAGTSVLRFDADGLVAEQWDTWNQASARIEPIGGPFGRQPDR
jgi:hypothetical protein